MLQRAGNLAAEAASVARGASGLVSVGYTTTAAHCFLPRWLELGALHRPQSSQLVSQLLELAALAGRKSELESRRLDPRSRAAAQ